MSKKSQQSRKELRNQRRTGQVIDLPIHPTHHEVKPLKPRTPAQKRYLSLIENNTITFATGPAGTGKTYVAGAVAAQMLQDGDVERLIFTRPAVEAGERFGFLPGELDEKYAPYIEPFRDVLNERLGRSFVDYCLKHGRIVASPLSFMRGKTFKDCLVVLDEAQNTTPEQMKLFLTRIGDNCKVIVDGDIKQKDVSGLSGLQDAVHRLRKVPSVGFIEFSVEDIVRSGIVRHIIEAYD